MKILSKYKDYYDYLSGVYGEDPKIVLDRREFKQCEFYSTVSHPITLYVAGIVYDGWNHFGKLYWGEQLKEICSEKPKAFWYYKNPATKDNDDYVYIVDNSYREGKGYLLCILPYIDKDELNKKHDCPIILSFGLNKNFNNNNICKYPKLIDLGVNKIIDAQTIYLNLTDWLSPKDDIQNTQSDKEKILSNGFDLKTSFRNVK